MMETADRSCFHCGEPIPSDVRLSLECGGQSRQVCCSGCLAVARLIAGSGLDNYYRYRQQLGTRVTHDMAASQAAWQAVDDRTGLWGVELPGGERDLLLQTEGIRCAACAWLIRSHLEGSRGVRTVQVDASTGYTRITWSPAETHLSRIALALFELGYKPHLPIASAEEQGRLEERRVSLKRLGVAGLGMMQVMMYAVGLYAGDAFGISAAEKGFLTWVSLLVTLPVLLYSGRVFFVSAWHGLRAMRPGMDLPVALAIGLAFTASCVNFFRGEGDVWFDSVVMFIFFLTFGRHVELVLRHRNLRASTALARLLPEWAKRLTPGGSETIPASDLLTGDQVRVAVGEPFPADGRIITGTTDVDEALLTGESRPLLRRPGELVVAGTVNLTQSVEIEVTAAGSESTVSALGRLLLTAQSRRASDLGMPAWLVPAFIATVLTIAFATWLYWHQSQPDQAFSAMLAVLVASCPCALSLALPAVYSAASQRLLMEGILLTRGDALHDLLRVDTVIFDKTGTLTRGYPEIRQVDVNPDRPDCDEDSVLQIAAALEAHSAHPVARAFPFEAGPISQQGSNVIAVPGGGLEGKVAGRQWRIGTREFVVGRFTVGDTADGLDEDSSGEIWLADENSWCARFTLVDALRPDCETAIQALAKAGLDIRICSGDGGQPVGQVARMLGITTWLAHQTAAMKLHEIHTLQGQGRSVLMVGDGVNDGPVLAAARVSMTVKGATELANSAADLILTAESLRLVSRAFEVARKAAQLIRQNLVWALLYNASVLPLAVSGALQPWMAALGMSLSSLLVVLNATRISRLKPQ